MSVHIHTMRNWSACALALVPGSLLFSWNSESTTKDFELAQVSGRVTCAGRPFDGIITFLPHDGRGPIASGSVNPDGSFQLHINGRRDMRGTVPGTYRVLVCPRDSDQTGSRVDRKYQNPHTTDLLVHIGPDWNHVSLNLH